MNFENIKSIHFVGIGGIGMSGIAEVLAERGLRVSGCDLRPSRATEMLAERGIHVFTGHDPSHLDGVDTVVVTAAVRGDNAEIDEAMRRGLSVWKRKEILGAIAGRKRTVGVSGTHGKTTTTAMIAIVLEEAGLDPTILVGGMLQNIGSNAKNGASDFLVVEADEYDRTFHQLRPEIAIVTNIEADHLEYFGSFDAIVEAFRIFAENLRPGGLLIGCADDPVVAQLLSNVPVRVVRYGLGPRAELTARNVQFHERGSSFEVEGFGFFKLFVPGEHNVRNALAAIAVARELGVDAHVAAAALAKFLGVDRRFQILGDYAGALVVDDYAHHPTEIRATLDAARSGYPRRRIVALFQPHLYSRTRDFAREFGRALNGADVALVTEIYPSRESPIPGVSGVAVVEAAKSFGHRDARFLPRRDEIVPLLDKLLSPGDLLVTMGAGDVYRLGEEYLKEKR